MSYDFSPAIYILYTCKTRAWKIFEKIFGGFRNNAYLCSAKMIVRYEIMPPRMVAFVVSVRMEGPLSGQ